MAKLKPDPITKKDLVEYLNDYSDFSFEIKTLKLLIELGFTCKHAGTYDDPVTKTPREYDIRAVMRKENYFLHLAVECKNLRPNFPLLVSCLPRRPEESFHEIIYSINPERRSIEGHSNMSMLLNTRSESIRLKHTDSFYRINNPVGKSCNQVGRLKDNQSDIKASDADIYPKWSQALSSADDLVDLACSDAEYHTKNHALSLVIPLVVVPDGQLWRTIYDAKGSRISEPEKINRCSYYVNREYNNRNLTDTNLVISHLEFVTSTGLINFVKTLCENDEKIKNTFPIEKIKNLIKEIS